MKSELCLCCKQTAEAHDSQWRCLFAPGTVFTVQPGDTRHLRADNRLWFYVRCPVCREYQNGPSSASLRLITECSNCLVTFKRIPTEPPES